MVNILTLLLAVASADYDVMQVDLPAEQKTKLFAGCTNYDQGTSNAFVLWCEDTYPGVYSQPPNAGRPVSFGTIDPGFEWFSDLMGACRLHAIEDHGTYKSYHFSCYTDRIFADGSEE
jgi:hypothetical protein